MPRTTSRSRTRAPAARDALAVLKADHQAVKKLFASYRKLMQGDGAGDADKQELAARICSELTVHARLEEEIFYPALRRADVDADLLAEAEVEHATAKDLIAQIRSGSPDDGHFDARVIVLGEYIDHHVGEEEGEIFRKARSSDLDLDQLGSALEARRPALEGEAAADGERDEDDDEDEESEEEEEEEGDEEGEEEEEEYDEDEEDELDEDDRRATGSGRRRARAGH